MPGTTPTSMLKRLTGDETWTDTITFATGKGISSDTQILSSAAATVTIKANTAAAYSISDATTGIVVIDTRNTVTVQNIILTGPAAQTLPNAASSRARIVSIPSRTITLLGTTQVTTEMLGIQLFIDAPTIAQSGGAVTVDRMSTLHVARQ